MRRLLSVLFILSLSAFRVIAQNDYYPIQSEGEIPDEFIALTSDKIARANANYKGETAAELSKNDFVKFNSITNFYIDQLLKEGKIVFGTSMNDYVNRVGAYVLQSFPDIKDEVRFYIVKSPTVNAFTTQQGIIFINIGLIAQLENEAQLAYIISHELIHYKYKHVFESFVEKSRANTDWGDYRNLDKENKEGLLLQYSRAHEFMADSLGFIEGFSHTKYDFDEALSVFDVLLYSNLPFDEIEFDSTFFNDANYTLDSKYMLKKVALISNPENYEDKHLTHPNIKNRRSVMINLVTSYDNPSKQKYIISKPKFKQLQKEARFEMSNLYLSSLQYGKAFYNSYLLLRKYPDNKYLQRTIVYSLYGASLFKRRGNISDVVQSYKTVQGPSQRVNYFLRKANSKTLSSLAIKFIYEYHKKYPEDTYINNLLSIALKFQVNDVGIDFARIYEPVRILPDSILQDTSKNEFSDGFRKLSQDEYNILSKYDKIRYDKKYREHFGSRNTKSVSTETKVKNYLHILSAEKNDNEFKTLYTNSIESEEEKKEQIKVSKFMLVNPLFFQVKDDDILVEGAENIKNKFTNSIKNMAYKRNIGFSRLDILDIKSNDVDKFNDLARMNSWLSEYQSLTELDTRYIIPWQSAYIGYIKDKYNSKYIATSGLLAVESNRPDGKRTVSVISGLVFWQAAPFFFFHAITNYHHIYYYFVCIDITTNEQMYFYETSMEGKPKNDFMNSINYEVMYNLSK